LVASVPDLPIKKFGCLTYKHPNTSTVFAFYRETLSRFSCAASIPAFPLFSHFIVKRFRVSCAASAGVRQDRHRAGGDGVLARRADR
ncbi:hypothetical protein ABLN72_03090, partial [Mycobacterium tuberculosis]